MTPTIPTEEQQTTPAEFLAQFPNAPTEAQIETWKKTAPGNRLMLLPLPANRVFIFRALSVGEVEAIELRVLNQYGKEGQARCQKEVEAQSIVQSVLYTNVTNGNRVSLTDIPTFPAGLVGACVTAINQVSDYFDPSVIAQVGIAL